MKVKIEYILIFIIFFLFLGGNFVFAKAKKIKIPKVDLVSDIKKKEIKKELNDTISSVNKKLKEDNYLSSNYYWLKEGKEVIERLLRSYGFYESIVNVNVVDDKIVKINIKKNIRYTISNITYSYAEGSNKDINIKNIDQLKIKKGDFANANSILVVQKNILKYIEENNCLFNIGVFHEVVLDHTTKSLSVNYIINAGKVVKIGDIEIEGLKRLNQEYVRKIIKLKKGDCFKRSYMNEVRGELQKTGLFFLTDYEIPKEINEKDEVPILFKLKERKPRSLKAGLRYGTDLGIGGVLGWEHRNFSGNGEKVDFNLFLNKKEKFANLTYTKPFFKYDNQKLILKSDFEDSTSKAFKTKEVSVSAYIERELSKKWSSSIGFRVAQSKTRQTGESISQNFSFLSFPISVIHSTKDNLLNPRRGKEVQFETAPYFTVKGKNKPFLRNKVSVSGYFLLHKKSDTVLAIKTSLGSMFGIDSVKVPIGERFYVGGSNSLRGYAYQLAGEIDRKNNNRPTGGKSFVENSIELRFKLRENIGLVSFLDSGFAYSGIIPRVRKKMLHGFGFGIRYYSDFAPLRFDVGFPINRRKFIDKSYQIYFGIGQAF